VIVEVVDEEEEEEEEELRHGILALVDATRVCFEIHCLLSLGFQFQVSFTESIRL
jgi:hypothetical protein